MWGEALMRVQFLELVQLITSQSVTTEDELLNVKARIMNPEKGVSFTPQNMPRFSSDLSWEYAEEEDSSRPSWKPRRVLRPFKIIFPRIDPPCSRQWSR
jgi:hypothetical protein